jgi:GH24 family phage-related lysozyme (muramidase)
MSRAKRMAAAAALAIAIAIPAEGLRQVAYYDPPGILTVCYGSTTNVEKGREYSLTECKERLNADMLQAVATVDRCAPGLPENVLGAFGDAVYNVGPTIACDTRNSTAARLLKDGKLIDACNQLPRWNKARVGGVMVSLPGLAKRRAAERDVCLRGLT